MTTKENETVIGEETTGSGSGKHSVWLPSQIITALRLNALMVEMSQKEYLNEIVVDWLLYRNTMKKEEAINLKYSYPYPYLQIPTNTVEANFTNCTLYLERNISSWVLQYAFEDSVKITTVLYTALYLGLVRPDWFKSIGHHFSLKKNEAPKWPILDKKKR